MIQVNRNGYIFQIEDNMNSRMFGFRFKGGGANYTKPPAPTATAKKMDAEAAQKDRDLRRQRVMAAGRAGTLLTEKTNDPTASASLLGRTA